MIQFEKRIEQSRKIDALIEQKTAEFKLALAPYVEARNKIRASLLDMLNQTGQNSAPTAAGTVYRTDKVSCTLEDPDAFRRHIIGTESWDLADWKANSTACVDFVEANSHLPPGVKMTTIMAVGVRAPVKKKLTKAERAAKALGETIEAEDEGEAEAEPQSEAA